MRTHHTFSGLDALRGIVALCVCLHHTQDYWGIQVARPAIAVDLFFMLGGFVVAHSYERRLLDGRISFTDFVRVRLIRLYPLYLFSVLLIALPLLAGLFWHRDRPDHVIHEYVWATVLNGLMLPARISDAPWLFYPLNIVYWSMLWVLVTNLLYACLIHRLTTRVLMAVTLMSGFVLTALVFHKGSIGLGMVWGTTSVLGGLARAVFGMSVGVLLFRHYRSVPQWLVGDGGYLLPVALVLLCVWIPASGSMDWMLQLLAVLVVFPWCVLRAARGSQPSASSLLPMIGFVSYPIYILHMPLVHLLDSMTAHRLGQFGLASCAATLAVIVGVAMLVDRRLDRPFRNWLTSRTFGREPASAPLPV
jgi:peptidoglycan/LPS O-acetylase OafA/YrhL